MSSSSAWCKLLKMIFHNVTPTGLCSDFISAVLMGTLPGALNRLVLPVTSPILFCFVVSTTMALPLNWIHLKIIGARCARPTLVGKTKICLFTYWGSLRSPHTCGENENLSIYIYGTCVFRIYIYILPHLCAMQYFHIACWLCNHCCSRDKTNRTERLNSGNQRNRNLKTVRKGRHYYQDGG